MEKITKIFDGLKGVPQATWMVLISLALIFVNAILTAFNINPIDLSSAEVYQGISYAIALGGIGYAIWRNFNFTDKAQAAQQLLVLLKEGLVTIDEVIKFINEIQSRKGTEKESDGE